MGQTCCKDTTSSNYELEAQQSDRLKDTSTKSAMHAKPNKEV